MVECQAQFLQSPIQLASNPMYLPFKTSQIRQREAQNARNNRAEIVRALSQGEITKRDLLKWGIFTTAGLLVAKNGLSPYARSAFAGGPTGAPRSPLFGAQKFTERFDRLRYQKPVPLTVSEPMMIKGRKEYHANFPINMKEHSAKRLSYHTDFTAAQENGVAIDNNEFRNPLTNRGPMEGRPPGEMFSHQRWEEFFPKLGYVTSIGSCADGTYFHSRMAHQNPNSVWSYGSGQRTAGSMPPPSYTVRPLWVLKGFLRLSATFPTLPSGLRCE